MNKAMYECEIFQIFFLEGNIVGEKMVYTVVQIINSFRYEKVKI